MTDDDYLPSIGETGGKMKPGKSHAKPERTRYNCPIDMLEYLFQILQMVLHALVAGECK